MMNLKFKKLYLIILLIAGFVLMNSLFVVNETQQVLVLEFGKPVKFKDGDKEVSFVDTPGLKFKVPFIQDLVFFDKRLLDFRIKDKEVLDSENKTLIVNAYAKYKITDPLVFYQKVTDIRGVEEKLDNIFQASLRKVIGTVTIKTLLSEERKKTIVSIKEHIRNSAKDFGIEVTDVRIIRADLPKENSNAIFRRMFTDRSKEAREYRAKGKEDAQKIRSTALKEATIIKAQAERDAQILRGQGDAEASKIFAAAFSKDPEFFEFYRTMVAYRETMKKGDTTMLLSPKSDFMKYFKDQNNVK